MTKYKIVKESEALPLNAKVGATVDSEGNIEINFYGGVGSVGKVSKEHLAALLELGVVEEVKEIKGRACCFNCDIRDRAEEYGYPVGGCMKQPVKKEYSGIDSVTLNGVEIQQNGIIRNSKGRLIGRLDGVEYESEHVQRG